MTGQPHYLALSGGVGGAKLALGLSQVLTPQALTIAVNVGDDFEHLGLPIWPDLDTVLYTLADLANPNQGWGRHEETWQVLQELKTFDGPDWFLLGDKDIALHLLRRHLLDQGMAPSDVAVELCRRLGVLHRVFPITDQTIRTWVNTDEGWLEFQRYFVGRRAEPTLLALEFRGANSAVIAPQVQAALNNPNLAGIILCPSNPYLSIAPMLAVPGLRQQLANHPAPVIAVSPIVAGQALKGPAAKIMAELGVNPTATVINDLYSDFVDLVIIDDADKALSKPESQLISAPTVMRTLADKTRLATLCIEQLRLLSQSS